MRGSNATVKILIVASGNNKIFSPFVQEQTEIIRALGHELNYFLIKGKGVFGFLGNWIRYRKHVQYGNYDLIHAHYGVVGLFAGLQWHAPVVVTYVGSDIGNRLHFLFSFIGALRADYNIFVSKKLRKSMFFLKKESIIPYGVDLKTFYPMPSGEKNNKIKKVLFAGAFSNKVKNFSLAKEALSLVKESHEILELMKGYSREEINILMNEADVLLLTSFREGSPQVIKEALACNLPIVSVNVGDVQEIIQDADNCFVVAHDPVEIAEAVETVFKNQRRSKDGRIRVQGLELMAVAHKILSIYNRVLE